jgi:hypothetical protein
MINKTFTPLTVYSGGREAEGRDIPEYARGALFASRRTEDGYTFEAAIPFSIFRAGEPVHGGVFGMDITLNDQDFKDIKRDTIMAWAGEKDNNRRPSNYARIKLIDRLPSE